MNKTLLTISSILWLLPLMGQYHATHTYTIKNGLFSSELFAVLVDREGYIWTGSANGVSRFDGTTFTNYTVKEGLWRNSVSKILEDGQGNIWFVHSGGLDTEFKVSIWLRGKIDILDIGKLTGSPNPNIFWNPFAEEIQVFSQNTLWVYDPEQNHFYAKRTLPTSYDWATLDPNIFSDPFQDRYFLCSPQGKESPYLKVSIWENRAVREIPIFLNPPSAELLHVTSMPEGEILMHFANETYYLHEQQEWKPFASTQTFSQQTPLRLTKNRTILWKQMNEGAIRLTEISDIFPQGVSWDLRASTSVSGVSRSPDGTYWASTRSGLIHVFPAFLNLISDNCQNQALADVHAISEDTKGNIWFGSYTFGLSYFDGKTLQQSPLLPPSMQVLPGTMRDENGFMRFWISEVNMGNFTRGQIAFDGSSPPRIVMKDTVGYYFHQAYDGQIGLGLSKHGLGIINPNAPCSDCIKIIGEEKGHQLINIITTVKDRYGRWWMGRPSAGIAYYDTGRDTIYSWLRKEHNESIGVMSSLMDSRGNLWFGTTDGLRFFHNRKEIDPTSFNPLHEFKPIGSNELGRSQVNAMALYDENTLIVGNNDGIALVDLEPFYKNGQARIYFIDQADGYSGLGTEQNCLLIDQNRQVWIGSDAGVHRFDPRLFVKSQQVPSFTIDSLSYGGETHVFHHGNLRKRLILKRNRASSILTTYLTPKRDRIRPNHLFFSHQLSTDSTFSLPNSESTLNLSNLSPGNYTLKIKAFKDGLESEVQVIRFQIPKSIWATPWPYLLFLILGGTGLWGYQYRRHRVLLEKNKLQVQAIVNQLNPHFINNTLQWVQIRAYKDAETVSVISKLGENIRVVFKNSRNRKAFHSLQEEMRLVKNYLFIQKKRFGDHLEYQLPAANILEDLGDISVPLMQIQIHCENAVEHGIRNKESPGRVVIRLIDQEAFLYIVIEDDGVGRQKAAELGSKGTQQGTKMLNSLKDIFNKHNSLHLRSEYEDDIFQNPQGKGYGTRVHIWIPKKYRYEFD